MISPPLATLLIGFLSLLPVAANTERRVLWQPIHNYDTIVDPEGEGRQGMGPEQRINPFLSYTAIGTDYGFTGEDKSGIGWEPSHLCVMLPPQHSGGVWHSLAGRALDLDQTLNFLRCYPTFIADPFQPHLIGFRLSGRGHGQVKLEVKSPAQEVLWSQMVKLEELDEKGFVASVPALTNAKFVNWTGEPGADFCLDRLDAQISLPPLDPALQIFLSSYAKLARCYSPRTGLVRDRAHIEDGAFDSIPASGMFCLATAAAAKMGIVSQDFALGTLKRTHAIVSSMETKFGVLPHFVRLIDGVYRIHPDTEFSTVDTAIYLHAMLLAGHMLADLQVQDAVIQTWQRLEFNKLRDAQNRVVHGVTASGEILPFGWSDWGGETALVLLTQRVAVGPSAPNVMVSTGKAFQGTGFITELQSLFHPDFDRAEPDLVSAQSWRSARLAEYERQINYFSSPQAPEGQLATQKGLFGLSAGEGRRGQSYDVGGTELNQQRLIHPHYILMAACTAPDPHRVVQQLVKMQDDGYFPPWGMVENIDVKTGEALNMIGSLNASFETLGAYHLWAKVMNQPNLIYQASRENQVIRDSMTIFWK